MSSLLSEELTRQGFEIFLAEDGEKAVERFGEVHPDVLIVDILLPKQNGIEALRQIRALPGGATVPALVLSNLEDANYIRDAEKLGIKSYLIKANVQLPEIVAKVRELIQS